MEKRYSNWSICFVFLNVHEWWKWLCHSSARCYHRKIHICCCWQDEIGLYENSCLITSLWWFQVKGPEILTHDRTPVAYASSCWYRVDTYKPSRHELWSLLRDLFWSQDIHVKLICGEKKRFSRALKKKNGVFTWQKFWWPML